MDFARTTQEGRLERLKARSKAARKWARLSMLGVVGLSVLAIWQEPGLAPKLNAKLQEGYVVAMEFIEADGANSYLTAMTGFSGNGNQSEYNAITTWLLNNRN